MSGDKFHVAIDVALALSELKKGQVIGVAALFLFPDGTEMPLWEITDTRFSGGTTDTLAALVQFGRSTRIDQGDLQVYLVTIYGNIIRDRIGVYGVRKGRAGGSERGEVVPGRQNHAKCYYIRRDKPFEGIGILASPGEPGSGFFM